jgi:hypothetical protein
VSTSLTTHSPADILLAYLEQEDLHIHDTVEWEVMVNIMLPTNPDRIIVGIDTQGSIPIKYHNGTSWDRAGVQLVVRGAPNEITNPRAILHNIESGLLSAHRALITYEDSSYRLHNVQRTSGPIPLPRDQSLRWLWSVNYMLTITQET